MTHTEPHPMAGKTVEVISGKFKGEQFRIEDWDDRIDGSNPPWYMRNMTNPAVMEVFMRQIDEKFPMDNETVYGKIGHLGHIMHLSQLKLEVPA